MKQLIFVLLLFWSCSCFCQFPSTSSFELINNVPKAKKVGDTVYTSSTIQPHRHDGYVLIKIDRDRRYVYRPVNGSRKKLKIEYDDDGRIRSYYYKFNGFGGEGKGYFQIHYYPNGNIKDYALVDFYYLNQPHDLVLFDSLSYPEKDRSRIPGKEYRTFYKRNKVYLFKGPFDRKKLVRKIREVKDLKPVHIVEGFPFPIYLLE